MGEGPCGRYVTINFLVILCINAFIDILGRSYLVNLDVVASPVHLKRAYHDTNGKPTVTSADLGEANRIKEIILRTSSHRRRNHRKTPRITVCLI